MQSGSGTGDARERQHPCGCLSPWSLVSKPNSSLVSSSVFLYQLPCEITLNHCPTPLYIASLHLLPNNWTNTTRLLQTQVTELVQPFKRLLEHPVPLTPDLSGETHEKAVPMLLLARAEPGHFDGLPACEIAICKRPWVIFPMYLQGWPLVLISTLVAVIAVRITKIAGT